MSSTDPSRFSSRAVSVRRPARVAPLDAGVRPEVAAEQRRVGRNVRFLAAGQLITWSMTLLWTLVVPRVLGPGGLGTVMAAWSITGILSLALGLGTRNYLVRMSVVEPGGTAWRIGTTLVLRTVLSPLVFGASFAYGELVGWGLEAKVVLYLAAFAAVFIQVAEPLQAGFQATERMEYLAYSDVISKSGQGLVGILVVLVGLGAVGVTASSALMAGIVIALDLYWLRGRVRVDLRTDARRMVRIARESLPYWASGVILTGYRWVDFVILSLLAGADAVGWYTVPVRLFQTLMFLPAVVATAWLPRFVRSFERGGDEFRQTARRPIEFVLILSFPICAMTVIAAGPVIDVLYGSEYVKSVPVLALLALTIPLTYMNSMFNQVLIAMGRPGTWTCVMAGSIVVNPLLNLALIPLTERRFDNGAIGAAISFVLTELAVCSAGLALVGRRVFDTSTVRRTVLAVLSAVTTCGVAFAVAQVAGGAASVAAGLLTFVVAAHALRIFTSDEVELMRKGVARVGDRLLVLGRRATAVDVARR